MHSQFRSTGQELPQLQLCNAISEREDWTHTRDQEDQAENSVVFLLLTSFRATLVLRGHLGRGDKELTFSKERRGERQMDRGRGRGETDGWRGKGEVREKAVSSAEAKAVLQIQTHLLSYKVKWKGQECEPCLLNEKQNCSNGLVFYNMYKAHCKPVPQIHTKHTTIFKKQGQMGAWLYLLESWGHNWADSHFLSKGIGLGKMVSPISTFINERGSLPKLLLTGAAWGSGNDDGEEAVWSPANGSKTKGFFQVPRTQLEQKQGLGNRKVWRSEVLTTKA